MLRRKHLYNSGAYPGRHIKILPSQLSLLREILSQYDPCSRLHIICLVESLRTSDMGTNQILSISGPEAALSCVSHPSVSYQYSLESYNAPISQPLTNVRRAYRSFQTYSAKSGLYIDTYMPSLESLDQDRCEERSSRPELLNCICLFFAS
jgi:hypothetical protein